MVCKNHIYSNIWTETVKQVYNKNKLEICVKQIYILPLYNLCDWNAEQQQQKMLFFYLHLCLIVDWIISCVCLHLYCFFQIAKYWF